MDRTSAGFGAKRGGQCAGCSQCVIARGRAIWLAGSRMFLRPARRPHFARRRARRGRAKTSGR
eukprot:1553417-Lingulodinium_polyedra.AAC.1